MPEIYGWIKKVRQRDITIERVNIHFHRQGLKKFKEEQKEDDEWRKALNEWKKTREGERPKPPPKGIAHELLEMAETGPKVTLSCVDAHLIDKAIELINFLCKFEVKEGHIVKIERARVIEEP